jgi:CheY-like chemotaxis protein
MISPGKPRRLRIAVSDNNVDVAESLGLLLETLGHETRLTHDAATVMQVVAEFNPHIVILDIGMPPPDGLVVARQLRELPTGAAITLVAVTGWGTDSDCQKTDEVGFNFHFVKPLTDVHLNQISGVQALS